MADTAYFLTDHQGSTRALISPWGEIISGSEIDYDSFGNITGTPYTRYLYTGREWDADAQLYYHRARYYDPQARRFISEDPIGLEGGINLYAYVGNNPISNIDPDGEKMELASGLKADYGKRIINNLAEAYRKQIGRDAIDALFMSSMMFTFGEQALPDSIIRRGNSIEIKSNPGKTTCVMDGHLMPNNKADYIEESTGSCKVNLDFGIIDSLRLMPMLLSLTEGDASNHELGHSYYWAIAALITYNKSNAESEDDAKAFVKTMKDQKNTMKKKDAERIIKRYFGVK